ncbi:MAG: class I SAM-dependent rRNA methyltransferase [Thermoanaerobaculia bacterium]
MTRARVVLGPGREKSVLDGHPWIFSGSVAREENGAGAALAEIVASDGRTLGVGFYSAGSRIRVRRLAPPGTAIDRAFFTGKLTAAAAWRRGFLPERTTGYRVLNAEGDGVPGWTVDRFGDVLVSQFTVAGLEGLKEEAYAALAALWPESRILHLGDIAARKEEKLPRRNEWIAGDELPESGFEECGLRFVAELAGGQKTGFYCDQRDNRRRAAQLAGDRAVLDLFAHSGAFSLHALRGGARSVTMVDSAARLLELARRGIAENGLDASRAGLVAADVFEDLRSRRETYDLVVCDPPPLARRKEHVERAARAYKDLNRLALERLTPGGLLMTFSCSGAIDSKLFRQILFAAAVEARVDLALVEPLAAAPDHPVSVFHPQGEYLKGWLAVARGRLG